MPNVTTFIAHKHVLLKAEALCAELVGQGVSFDKLTIRHAGSFRKSYRNDIEHVEQARDGSEQIYIEINRDSFYDKLPEGLFHQTRGGGGTSGLRAMVGEYRRYRDEEKVARKFFQPLEQEFFRYAVMVEEGERKLQFGILNGNLESDFYRFWNIDKSLPAKPASVLALIMPWIRQIKGDMKLTAKALSMILDKRVQIEMGISEEQTKDESGFRLGENVSLSMNTICGRRFTEPVAEWLFTIHDLNPGDTEQYTPGRPYGKLLQRFEELFVPLEMDARFDYQYEIISEATYQEPVLGYGFYL